MQRAGVLTYSVEGAEKLGRPGQMIIANHPSLIDVVFLIGLVRQANCVVKQSLWQNPFTRGPVRDAGYISNDGSAEPKVPTTKTFELELNSWSGSSLI